MKEWEYQNGGRGHGNSAGAEIQEWEVHNLDGMETPEQGMETWEWKYQTHF